MSSTAPPSPTARELALQLLFHPNALVGIGLILQAIDPARMYKAWIRSEKQSIRGGYAPYDTGTSGFVTNEIVLYYGVRDKAPRRCPNPDHAAITTARFCGH